MVSGYDHIVPGQACYPRQYDSHLAERIASDLDLAESDAVVLKLCNRSRAAGVIVVPLDELDEVLEELLVPPPLGTVFLSKMGAERVPQKMPTERKMEAWLEENLKKSQERRPGDFGLTWGCFEEQKRHWWANVAWTSNQPFDTLLIFSHMARKRPHVAYPLRSLLAHVVS